MLKITCQITETHTLQTVCLIGFSTFIQHVFDVVMNKKNIFSQSE